MLFSFIAQFSVGAVAIHCTPTTYSIGVGKLSLKCSIAALGGSSTKRSGETEISEERNEREGGRKRGEEKDRDRQRKIHTEIERQRKTHTDR